MARIQTYGFDENVSEGDYFVGTDADDNLATKSYRIGDILNLIGDEAVGFTPRTALPLGASAEPTYSDSAVAYTKYGRIVTVFLNITISSAPTTGSGSLDVAIPENFRPYQQVRLSVGNDIYSGAADGFIFVTIDNFGNIGIQNNGLYTGNFQGVITYVAEENSSS